MLEEKIKNEGLDCCVTEVGEMIQNLVRTLRVFERNAITDEGFTISQSYILIYLLKSGSLSMNEISEKMNLDRSTITRILDNLIRDGYIEKNRSKNDGRVILASLTPQGKEKTEVLKQKVNQYYKEIIDAVPEGEVLEVVSSVNTLLEALKEVRPMCC